MEKLFELRKIIENAICFDQNFSSMNNNKQELLELNLAIIDEQIKIAENKGKNIHVEMSVERYNKIQNIY